MSERSLIIIGAGLAGLATGCYVQANGYQSHIFEHHSVLGGVPSCLYSGRHAVQLLCRQDREPFVGTLP